MLNDETRFRDELRLHVAEIVRLAKAHRKAGWSAGASEWLEDAANEILDAADGHFDTVADREPVRPNGLPRS